MFVLRNFLIHLIFLIVKKSTFAEWVEVPQFSDNGKVYRVPLKQYELAQKYSLNNRNGPNIYEHTNTSSAGENFRRRFSQQQVVDETTETIFFDTSEITTSTKHPQNNEDYRDDAVVENNDEEIVTLPTTFFSENIFIEGDQLYQAIPDENQTESDEPEVVENNEDTSFLAFIPIELFKKVHAILKSQSMTVEGKIDFLKRFEKTLLGEIEKRLVPVISPVRKKRESRGDHGWDDHHDGVGFPSLEGALMAISFLIFAVYLVQLVMLLFRNLGNNNSNTPATATVLFNRNKRSIDQFTEDTARILNYLDEFAKNMKSR